MAKEKRLIDANAYPCQNCEVSYCYKNCKKFNSWLNETVDAVEVEDPELRKAIELLIKQYDRSKASEYVHSPVAHALYHTWKQVDERR